MLDLKDILEQPERIKNNLSRRKADLSSLERIAVLGAKRGQLILETEQLKAKRNEVSKEVGKKKQSGQDASALISEMGTVGEKIKSLDAQLNETETELQDLLLRMPNLLHDSVPDGTSAEQNKQVRIWGQKPDMKFEPKLHDVLGEKSGLLDFARAARMTGARFTVLWSDAARLSRALIQFMLDLQREHGYVEVAPPLMVNAASLTGTGQLPKFKEDLFHLDLHDHDYYLIPTAEVPLTNLHADEVLEEDKLPLAYTAYTPCFRSEAGSYGKDTRGFIRQHQFDKVEIVRFSKPEQSFEQLELLTSHAEEVLKRLNLHYRVMALCAGDIGFGSTKTYDLEVYLPGQKAFREISSCSNFADFQARRAKIRVKSKETKKSYFAHTLNGSALAVGRTLVAIMENYQDQNGRIAVPSALQPYMGGKTHLDPYP